MHKTLKFRVFENFYEIISVNNGVDPAMKLIDYIKFL